MTAGGRELWLTGEVPWKGLAARTAWRLGVFEFGGVLVNLLHGAADVVHAVLGCERSGTRCLHEELLTGMPPFIKY